MAVSYPIPGNEHERNEAVRSYRIMNSPPEILFDEIGEIAGQICDCPISYISFIEGDRLWFKSRYGLPADFHGCPREIAFCSVTVCGADLVLSCDMTQDDRFRNFSLVVNEPRYRFYCAMPLITPQGYALGTICVLDTRPRELSFAQQEGLRRLAQQLVGLLEHRRRVIELDEAMHELDAAHAALVAEKAKTEDLLTRILPETIANELKRNGSVEPRFHASATVLIADVKGFTSFTHGAEPALLINMLNQYFAGFDEAIERSGLEKLKTIGDAYMAIAGVPISRKTHAIDACLAALKMLAVVDRLRIERQKLRLPHFEVRIGIHSGPVIAGVVGTHRFTYDVWGDTVNVAALMEASGEAGAINVSERVFHSVTPYFSFVDRGQVGVKHGQSLRMYFLDRISPDYAADQAGREPNERFFVRPERAPMNNNGFSRIPLPS